MKNKKLYRQLLLTTSLGMALSLTPLMKTKLMLAAFAGDPDLNSIPVESPTAPMTDNKNMKQKKGKAQDF